MKPLFAEKKRRKSLPIEAVCRNCEASLEGPYCHHCGQNLFTGMRRTVRDLVFNTLENMFVLDNKIFSTLKILIFHPGNLTKEYIKGRIIRYVHPSKLFWFITILFFTLLTFQINNNEKKEKKDKKNAELQVNNKENAGKDVLPAELSDYINIEVGKAKAGEFEANGVKADKSEQSDDYEDKLEKFVAKFADSKESFQSTFLAYAPYVVFLLIPFFAFLVYLFFYRKVYYYVDYLAFALHFHSFIFLLFTFYMAIHWIWPAFKFHGTVIFLLPPLYFIRALWVVYKPKVWTVLWRSSFIICIYGIAMFVVTIGAVVLIAVGIDQNVIK